MQWKKQGKMAKEISGENKVVFLAIKSRRTKSFIVNNMKSKEHEIELQY